MIRITIDLCPFGDKLHPETLGIMEIWNTLGGTKTKGSYKFRIFEKGSDRIWKTGDIIGFPRKKLKAWDLLYRCLKLVLYERNMG